MFPSFVCRLVLLLLDVVVVGSVVDPLDEATKKRSPNDPVSNADKRDRKEDKIDHLLHHKNQ